MATICKINVRTHNFSIYRKLVVKVYGYASYSLHGENQIRLFSISSIHFLISKFFCHEKLP